MSIKCPFITNLVLGKVGKENHITKVRISEERKVKNIGKGCCVFMLLPKFIEVNQIDLDGPRMYLIISNFCPT